MLKHRFRQVALIAALVPGLALAGAGTVAAHGQDRVAVVVTLADGVGSANAAAVAKAHRADLGFVYSHALQGFSAEIPSARLNGLERDPRVASVELDQEFTIAAQTVPSGIQRIDADTNAAIDIDGVDDLRVDVDIAILDSGIDEDHPDLNIAGGVNCAKGGPFGGTCQNGGFNDGNGHGTHVAGTAAALDNGFGVVGVAPGARLWGVRVLNNRGSGYTSWIVGGIDWVTANASTIEVANMSLGMSGQSAAIDAAISNSVAAGVTYVVAAGNDSDDAANYSPASNGDAITVSALADSDGAPGGSWGATCRNDQEDTLADFSNFGSAVDIAAPGVCTYSTYPGGYATMSGTSMASPHVAGAAGLLASTGMSVSQIRSTLLSGGTYDWTDESGDGILEPLLNVSTFTPSMI